MGRVNKLVNGVFVDIVGTDNERSSYDIFMYLESKNKSKDLNGFLRDYRSIIIDNKTTFEQLARLEEIIMQMRSMENIEDIKLSLVREYIYARCSFFRMGKTSKDIRVIVDNVEFWDNDVTNLFGNEKFMEKAKNKLVYAMTNEIESNIETYKTLYNEETN
jgi:hypothetical protein